MGSFDPAKDRYLNIGAFSQRARTRLEMRRLACRTYALRST